MNAALHAESFLTILGDPRRDLHFFGMQVLARELGQTIHLILQRCVQPGILVPETRGGIPHLKIEVGKAILIVKIGTFAINEDLGRLEIVDSIAK
jgi:hypothetical protein